MKDYEIIRSRRKTMALQITRDRRVVVRAPMNLSKARIDSFVNSHEDWIDFHMELGGRRIGPEPTQAEIAALKERARKELPPLIAAWSAKMEVTPTGFRVSEARSRYGSCGAKNSLNFSCFLMRCPEPAIELVVVHELCHIRVRNHNSDFYALLEKYLPDYREREKLLFMPPYMEP